MRRTPLSFIKKHRSSIIPVFMLVVLLGAGFLYRASVKPALTEVVFTDQSFHGMDIVPASCPSYPHYAGECSCLEGSAPLSGDSKGFAIDTGVTDQEVSRYGLTFCFRNQTGRRMFIPANTSAELTSFWNSILNARIPNTGHREHN